jgi:nucleolar pre-ribosomal-associated protein 1
MMDLLKKMWPTEVQYHKDLLLAIVNAKPSFGLLYLKEFPYNVESYKSSSWLVFIICIFISPSIHYYVFIFMHMYVSNI